MILHKTQMCVTHIVVVLEAGVECMCSKTYAFCHDLNLGFATKARLAKVRAVSETQESHFMLPKV
jgi:hypothetical protein